MMKKLLAMKVMKHQYYLVFLICFLLGACNTTRNKQGGKTVLNENANDSIFLLSITDIDGYGERHEFSFFLDSINNRLSIVGKYHQEINHYIRYSIMPGVSIEYDDCLEGHVILEMKDGLIVGATTNNASGIKYEYDPLCHLTGIVLNKAKKQISWNGDFLKQVIMEDSLSHINNHRVSNIYYPNEESPSYSSPELLKEISNGSWDEYLFFYLGMYGRLPIGKNYTIEDISYGDDGKEHKDRNVFKEQYSKDGYQIESENQIEGNERIRKRVFDWNQANLRILSKILTGKEP